MKKLEITKSKDKSNKLLSNWINRLMILEDIKKNFGEKMMNEFQFFR